MLHGSWLAAGALNILNTLLNRTLKLLLLLHSDRGIFLACIWPLHSFSTVSLTPTLISSHRQDVFLLNVWSHNAMLARNTDLTNLNLKLSTRTALSGGMHYHLVTSNKTTAIVEDFSTPPRNTPKHDSIVDLRNVIPNDVIDMCIWFCLQDINTCLFKILMFKKHIKLLKSKFHKVEII